MAKPEFECVELKLNVNQWYETAEKYKRVLVKFHSYKKYVFEFRSVDAITPPYTSIIAQVGGSADSIHGLDINDTPLSIKNLEPTFVTIVDHNKRMDITICWEDF